MGRWPGKFDQMETVAGFRNQGELNMKAGFIGLGTMGASMAANLQKGIQKDGHTVLVHDVRREAAASHIKNGAVWAASPAAIAEACDIVFSSLPGPVEFDAVS